MAAALISDCQISMGSDLATCIEAIENEMEQEEKQSQETEEAKQEKTTSEKELDQFEVWKNQSLLAWVDYSLRDPPKGLKTLESLFSTISSFATSPSSEQAFFSVLGITGGLWIVALMEQNKLEQVANVFDNIQNQFPSLIQNDDNLSTAYLLYQLNLNQTPTASKNVIRANPIIKKRYEQKKK